MTVHRREWIVEKAYVCRVLASGRRLSFSRRRGESALVPLALIPSAQTIAAAASLVERIDGLLLLGGVDVSPESYGAAPEPGLEATMPQRDRSEIALARAAQSAGLPVPGI